MEDLNGGAAAPAEAISAPVADNTPPPPAETGSQPSSQVSQPNTDKPAKVPTTRDALRAAASRVNEIDRRERAKTPDGPTRDEQGRFALKDGALPAPAPQTAQQPAQSAQPASKPAANLAEPPARFSAEAKAAWATMPDAVRLETHRALGELQQGIEKYKADATAYDDIRDFDLHARQGGTTLRQALTQYVNIEQGLRKDPIPALDQICQNLGMSLHQVATAVLGQHPDQQRQQSDATINELRRHVQVLQQQLGGVTQTIEQQRTSAVLADVDTFAADKPRFDELADDMVFLIESKRAKDLKEAYDLAERLNPAPAGSFTPPLQAAPQALTPPAPARPAPDLQAQTLKGSKSISGAPGSGSSPAGRSPSTSIRESLRRAVTQVGV